MAKWLQLEFSPRVYPSIKPQSGCQTLAQDELPYFLALLASSSFQSRALETKYLWGVGGHGKLIGTTSPLSLSWPQSSSHGSFRIFIFHADD